MRYRRKLLPAALLIGVVAAAAAETSADRGVAAAVFESGDYAASIRLYAKSREEAAKRGDDAAWIADTVALARAYLRSGDAARARALLAELDRRFPGRRSGGLEGEILAAEGRTQEAKRQFRRVVADPAADAKERGEAELALTHLLLASGEGGEAQEALEILARLEKDARFFPEARLRRIFGLIRAGRAKEALELAGRSAFKDDPYRRRLEILRLAALLNTGAADEFDAGWSKARNDILPRPDRLAFETLDQAAREAVKASRPERAVRYWNDAYGFADRDELRRDVLRKLFNCCAAFDAARAAAVARRYIAAFPDPGSGELARERARILSGAGQALGAAGNHKEALEFFRMVADDGKLPAADRRSAAGDAALTAEKLNDHETAKRYFESLVSTARNKEQLQSSQVSYAEYLIRRGDFSGAERLLRKVAGPTAPKLEGRIRRLLIQSLLAQDKFEDALAVADDLRRSPDPENSGFGEFYAALTADKLGRSDARARYLEYVGRHPKGEFVRQAAFAAAKLAEEAGEYAAAAKEFFEYGEKFSDDPNAGSALFWALRACLMTGDLKLASSAFAEIRRVAGVGPEYYAAALQLSDFMLRGRAAADALALLDKLDRSKCGGAEAAMLDLMRARVLAVCKRRDEALAVAEKLLNDHPGESPAADAAFMAGDLYLARENPEKALPYLLRARELRPSGDFNDAASARLADCRLELYKSRNSQQELQAAAAEYERLAWSEEADPRIRLMCKYKLGWCRERQNDPRAAVSAYFQMLLYAVELKKRQLEPDRKWCSLGAYAALNILLRSGWPDAGQRGADIFDAVRKLELPGGDAEFETVRKEFNERYLKREI